MAFEDLTSERVRQLLLALLREMDPERFPSIQKLDFFVP